MSKTTNAEHLLHQLVDLLSQKQTTPQPSSPSSPDKFSKLTELQKRQMAYQAKLANDKSNFIMCEIPKLYQQYIGPYLEVGHNGSTIKIPVDGRRYPIHRAFYPTIRKKLKHIDEKEARANNYNSVMDEVGDILVYNPH